MSTGMSDGSGEHKRGHHGGKQGHHSKHTATSTDRFNHLHLAGLAEAQPATDHMQHITIKAAHSHRSHATAPALAPAAAAAVARKRGHHAHHGGHHRHVAPAPTATSSGGAVTPVMHQNATSGVVSRITKHPPGVIGAPFAPPPPASHGGLSGGAIFGLVICILAVFGVVGFVVYRLWRKRNHMDPMFTMAPGSRGGYWGRRETHSHIVSPPPDDDITSFDQDFKHWVEVVGSASGKPYPGNNASSKYYNNNSTGGLGSQRSRPTLNRIPSGEEPVGSTENGTLVFGDSPSKIKVNRGKSDKSETGSMVNEPVSPLKAPPGFGPFGGAVMKLDPPPNPPSGVRAPPFQH